MNAQVSVSDRPLVRIAVGALCDLARAEGRVLRRKTACERVLNRIAAGRPVSEQLDELERLMKVPPGALRKRVRHRA